MDIRTRISEVLSKRERTSLNCDRTVAASVLIPLFFKDGQEYILYTKRSETVDTHKGQISFPGGVKDRSDKDFTETALRESYEELGLLREDIEVLGALDDMHTSTTGYTIYPLIGIIPYPYKFKINYDEIDEILEVPLTFLLDKKNYIEDRDYLYRGKPYHYRAFVFGKHHIWGTTAGITRQFLDLFFDWTQEK